MKLRQSVLSNGLVLVEVNVPWAQTTSLQLALAAGSRHEHDDENGVAHFLEHLVFRGSKDFPTERSIDWAAEELGAELNAFTDLDYVSFHVTGGHDRLTGMSELLTNFVLHPRLRAADVEIERAVILQEIAGCDDDLEERVDLLLKQAVFGEHPLGRAIVGTTASVSALTHKQIVGFQERQWVPPGAVAVVVGKADSRSVEVLARLLEEIPSRETDGAPTPAPIHKHRVVVKEENSHQSHLRLHWPTPELDIKDIGTEAALHVYLRILGGTLGSRLNEELRVKRGLCYHVSAGQISVSDSVGVGVSSELQPSRCLEAYEITKNIVKEMAENGPSENEVRRCRAGAIGDNTRGCEQVSDIAGGIVNDWFQTGLAQNPDDYREALVNVTAAGVARVAACVTGVPSVACIGPHKENDFR